MGKFGYQPYKMVAPSAGKEEEHPPTSPAILRRSLLLVAPLPLAKTQLPQHLGPLLKSRTR